MVKYYKNTVVYSSIITFISVVFYTLLFNYNFNENIPNITAVVFATIIYCGILSILSLTILLSKKKCFNINSFFRLLVWLLLPYFFIIGCLTYEILKNIKYNVPLNLHNLIYPILFNFPFFVGLLVNYLAFEKEKKVINKKIYYR